MTRLVLAVIAAMALSGCQHSGQQAIDPFWGQQRVPPPPTGSVGARWSTRRTRKPGRRKRASPREHRCPTAGSQTAPPNLLPGPTGTPGAATPIPATPGPGSGTPSSNVAPGPATPPASNGTPARAPLSGYSNPDWTPPSGQGLPGGNNARLGTGWFVSRQVRLAIDDAGRFHPADWRGNATRSPSWHILADGLRCNTGIVRFALARVGAISRPLQNDLPPNGSYKYDGSP